MRNVDNDLESNESWFSQPYPSGDKSEDSEQVPLSPMIRKHDPDWHMTKPVLFPSLNLTESTSNVQLNGLQYIDAANGCGPQNPLKNEAMASD